MKVGLAARGYTVIEVMIFMVISGVMFGMAATFVEGRQSTVEFKQAITKFDASIRSTMNDVSNGLYPSTSNFRCVPDASTGELAFSLTPTASTQGTRQGCVFMGKIMMFAVDSGEDSGFAVYTVAGRQFTGTVAQNTVPTTMSEAKPKILYQPGVVNMIDFRPFTNGVRITNVSNDGAATAGVGFFNSLASYQSAGTLASGSQSLQTVALPGSVVVKPDDLLDVSNLDATNTALRDDANTKSSLNTTICLEGPGDQYGTITIGGANGQRLTTKVQILQSKAPGC